MTTDSARLGMALDTLTTAVGELRDAVETIAGLVDLGGEAVFVRGNLSKATEALALVRELSASANTPVSGT